VESGTGAASGVGVVAVTAETEASLDGDLVASRSEVGAGDDWVWRLGDADLDWIRS